MIWSGVPLFDLPLIALRSEPEAEDRTPAILNLPCSRRSAAIRVPRSGPVRRMGMKSSASAFLRTITARCRLPSWST